MRTTREGVTMIELLLVMVLGMIIVAGAYTTLLSQTDAYGTLNAMSETQQATRMGLDVLGAELREVSANGSDLAAATSSSVSFRALRSFGILCDQNKINNKLIVGRLGVQPFTAGDSVLVYVDGDSLKAADDVWQREYVQNVASTTCGAIIGSGLSLGSLLPNATFVELSVGTSLKKDSIYPGAPIRSFNRVTYEVDTWDGRPMLVRKQGSDVAPLLLGRDPDGLTLRYFDELGNELTTFPLDAAARESVRRIQVILRSERRSVRADTYQDSLTTDVFLRGS